MPPNIACLLSLPRPRHYKSFLTFLLPVSRSYHDIFLAYVSSLRVFLSLTSVSSLPPESLSVPSGSEGRHSSSLPHVTSYIEKWTYNRLRIFFTARKKNLTGGLFGFFSFYVPYWTLLHLPPLIFQCVGRLLRNRHWQSDALTTRRYLIHKARSHPKNFIKLRSRLGEVLTIILCFPFDPKTNQFRSLANKKIQK
jgi:hypothetical protein